MTVPRVLPIAGPRTAPVLLVGYDAKQNMYTVIPYELGGNGATSKALAAGNGNGKSRQL